MSFAYNAEQSKSTADAVRQIFEGTTTQPPISGIDILIGNRLGRVVMGVSMLHESSVAGRLFHTVAAVLAESDAGTQLTVAQHIGTQEGNIPSKLWRSGYRIGSAVLDATTGQWEEVADPNDSALLVGSSLQDMTDQGLTTLLEPNTHNPLKHDMANFYIKKLMVSKGADFDWRDPFINNFVGYVVSAEPPIG